MRDTTLETVEQQGVPLRPMKALGMLRPVLALLVLPLVLSSTQPVWAKGVTFSPQEGTAATTVRGRFPMWFEYIRPRTVDLFLLPADAETVTSADDPRLVPVGQVVADRNNDGQIAFAVPHLDPGSYMAVVHYGARGGRGGTIFQAGSFTVLSPGTEVPASGRVSQALFVPVLAIGVLAATFALVGTRSLRRRSGQLVGRLFVGPHTPGG